MAMSLVERRTSEFRKFQFAIVVPLAVLALIAAGFVNLAFYLIAAGRYAEASVYVGVGVVFAICALDLIDVIQRRSASVAAELEGRYGGTAWLTPAGAKAVVERVRSGRFDFFVRLDNGETAFLPGCLLQPFDRYTAPLDTSEFAGMSAGMKRTWLAERAKRFGNIGLAVGVASIFVLVPALAAASEFFVPAAIYLKIAAGTVFLCGCGAALAMLGAADRHLTMLRGPMAS